MRTKNAMQLKARVNTRAREAGIPPQAMLQNYLLERLLERLSLSPLRNKVVVKGGMLISSLVGAASRTTMDLDTTVQGFALTHESAARVFSEIAAIEVDDDWEFEIVRTEDIREIDDYPGIRVHLLAKYPPMAVPLTVDVTTGDRITPGAIEYDYPLLFEDRCIRFMAYPLETSFAEKLETVVSRGVTNTRPRDLYDIYMLWRLWGDECDRVTLGEALDATCEKRGSAARVVRWREVLDEVENDATMLSLWSKYVKKNPYAVGVSLQECCETAREVMWTIESGREGSSR